MQMIFSNCSDYLYLIGPEYVTLEGRPRRGVLFLGMRSVEGYEAIPYAEPHLWARRVAHRAARGEVVLVTFEPLNWPWNWVCEEDPYRGSPLEFPALYASIDLLPRVRGWVGENAVRARRCSPRYARLYDVYLDLYRFGLEAGVGVGLFTSITGMGDGEIREDSIAVMIAVGEGRWCDVEFTFDSLKALHRSVHERWRTFLEECGRGRR